MKYFLGQHYTDNFQLRALAGCASGECLDGKNVSDEQIMAKIERSRPTAHATSPTIDSVCTMHPFYLPKPKKCNSRDDVCPNYCDGPCFYPAAAWGPLDERDLSRAIHSLEGFDLVLLTETLDNADQQALLADTLGIPRSINRSNNEMNANVEKEGSRELTHYYRDLMSSLTHLDPLVNALIEENRLEIELYEHAVRLNKIMTEKWKREVSWTDSSG